MVAAVMVAAKAVRTVVNSEGLMEVWMVPSNCMDLKVVLPRS